LEGILGLSVETDRDLVLLEHIEEDPDATQATLADQLGVAVGTVNWHIKRLILKGYVKVRRAERKKLRYIITPEGIALRTRLTVDYIQNSFRLYRLVRERVIGALIEVHAAGHARVRVDGEGDVAEVCRLTCLEQNFQVVQKTNVPRLVINGLKVMVDYPDGSKGRADIR
jgi:DNA-binding MarR family transcriptional regulator